MKAGLSNWLRLFVGVCASCAWRTLEAVEPFDARGVDASSGDATVEAMPDLAEAPLAARGDGAGRPDEGASSDGDSDDAAPSCGRTSAPLRGWNFATDAEQWTLNKDANVEATLAWTNAAGHPTPGALSWSVTTQAEATWARVAIDPADLRGRTLSAWVWLESGTNPHVKIFAQSGNEYIWADGGTVLLTPHRWTCLSMELSAPAYHEPGFDPEQIVVVGMEVQAETSIALHLDSVRLD